MADDSGRRPQWRGERRPVMVRVPLPIAYQLEQLADQQGASLSDVAGRLISVGLAVGATAAGDQG